MGGTGSWLMLPEIVHNLRTRYGRTLGTPEPPPGLPAITITDHHLPRDMRVSGRPILSGLHHEYGLEKLAA